MQTQNPFPSQQHFEQASMDVSKPASSEISSKEAWVIGLDEEISDAPDNNYESALPRILRSMLLDWPERGQMALISAAEQVDTYYWNDYLAADPLLRGQEDKGMAEFLSLLYNLLFMLAGGIPWDDFRQPALVGFLLELKKRPPTQFKIWEEDCFIYQKDPIFAVLSEDNWNRCYVHRDTDSEEKCSRWVNTSTFLAQCTGNGLYDDYDDRFKYPSVDIPLGLEREQKNGVLRDARLLVAAQWIRHAGESIHQDIQKVNKGQWTLEKWELWMGKLAEGVGDERLDEKVRKAFRETLEAIRIWTSTGGT